ncbi:thioredoxin domain-containing protein-like [Watersipora subatra]|uniref:thioredoxin domain-containing protein-like n=1 Tax=Watersipora subatra TaxID=2589382 RepID=UPI00355B3218
MNFGKLTPLLILSKIYCVVCRIEAEDSDGPIFNSEEELFENLQYVEFRAAAILSYGNSDERCEKIIDKLSMIKVLAEIGKYAEDEFDIAGGVVTAGLKDKAYEKKYSLKGCPNLVLYRQGRPIVYDGANLNMRFNREEIGQWVSRNMKSNVIQLSDDTFEHQTQASTGATTGDWLLWLHETSCSDMTAVWDAVASRLKYSKVVGELDTTLNPKVAERFNLQTCQSFLLLRRGKYYTYTGDAMDVQAFTNFAEISYSNFKSQVVRPPVSPFDEKVEEIVNWLKESEYGLYLLISVTFLLFGGIVYLVCQEAKTAADTEKKVN